MIIEAKYLILFSDEVPVLLAGGEYSGGVMQVFDLLSDKKCAPLAQYPSNVTGSAAGVIGDKVLICGGRPQTILARPFLEYPGGKNNRRVLTYAASECFIHDPSTNSWSQHANLNAARYYHASINVKDGVWFTGGLGWRGTTGWKFGLSTNLFEPLTSTEIVYSNGSVVRGPDMPYYKYRHCMVDLLDGRIMFIGGT